MANKTLQNSRALHYEWLYAEINTLTESGTYQMIQRFGFNRNCLFKVQNKIFHIIVWYVRLCAI